MAIVVAAIVDRPTVVFLLVSLFAIYDTLLSVFYLTLASSPAPSPPSEVPKSSPTVAVIIPAWNEQAALPHTIDSVLSQTEQPEMIIVADDGSTDETLTYLQNLYDLEFHDGKGRSRRHPNLYVLQKPHSGKADSMNQAIAIAHVDVILTLDADTRLIPGSITAMKRAFEADPGLTIVSGVLLPRCSADLPGRLFEFVQRYEYARMHVWRLAWSRLNSSLIISGACAAFRREVLLAIGGFNPHSWVEDYEILFRIHQYLRHCGQVCRVQVEPGLMVRTDAPDDFMTFLRQRRRWSGGFLETMFQNRTMVGDAKYSALGLLYLPQNTLTMPLQPLLFISGVIGSAIFLSQGLQPPPFVWGFIGIKVILDIAARVFNASLYRRNFRQQEVSLIGAIVEACLGSWLLTVVSQIYHSWGWVSCWRRQAKW